MPKISAAALRSLAVIVLVAGGLAACATPQAKYSVGGPKAGAGGKGGQPSGAGGRYKVGSPYQVGGIWYVPREDPDYDVRGVASWYGDAFHMKPTANGESFDMYAVSAAHPTLPLPSIVEVTNLENGKSLKVRVNDRGPFVGGRVIDLSHEAARQLGYDRQGLAKVRVRYVGPALLGGAAPTARKVSEAPSPPPAPKAPAIAAPAIAQYPVAPEDGMSTAAAPAAITQAALAPLAKASSEAIAAPAAAAPATAQFTSAPIARLYRIQAGAFGDVVNAQRAADTLSRAGARAVIEPVEQANGTLYRVMVQSTADEGEAWTLRDVVAAHGFADARVIRPF